MRSTHEYEDYLSDEDLFDDPYEVVMYDLNSNNDDIYTLFNMLEDDDRSWYAKRRLNALVASGPLSALVADIIVDSLGRRWDPLQHPRDRFGRFINTGGFLRWLASEGGDWLRGRVERIDSDGNIHVRSVGNDRVPDGTPYRFKPELSSKLVSTKAPVASLADLDLDADIPDFPEATDVQKRIYNNLAVGDMPAGDLDRALADLNLSTTDFAGEVKALEDRGLIEIDKTGDKPRVRRSDNDALGVVDVGDDEILDVPDDETPDLEDSPALTRQQRELIDFIADLDRGEGDGVHMDELTEVDEADVRALVDAGALVEGDDGNLHLQNPEEGDADLGEPAAEADITNEIFEASKVINDEAGQEAFQHYAEELARPGDENNAPLPDDVPPPIQRRAEAAANKWWADRNGDVTPDPNAEGEGEETDAPEAAQGNPKDSLNPRNQALADTLMGEEFPGDEFAEFLESNEGVKYAAAVKRLFDAEDLEEAGFSEQADAERFKFDREIRKVGFDVPEEDIEGWPLAVQNMREADREGADTDVTPEPDITDVGTPEPDITDETFIPDVLDEEPSGEPPFEDYLDKTEAERWDMFGNDLEVFNDVDHTPEEIRIKEDELAEYYGLDLADRPDDGFRIPEPAEPDDAATPDENELLRRFLGRPEGEYGPEVMRLRKAGLIEAVDDKNWRLTDEGHKRSARYGLGAKEETVDEPVGLDIPEDLPEPNFNLGDPDAEPVDAVDVGPDGLEMPENYVKDGLEHKSVESMTMLTPEKAIERDRAARAEESKPEFKPLPEVDNLGDLVNRNNDNDAAEQLPEPGTGTQGRWNQYVDKINELPLGGEYSARLEDEKRIAEELNLNLFDGEGPNNWNVMKVQYGDEKAARLYEESDGDLKRAVELAENDLGGEDVPDVELEPAQLEAWNKVADAMVDAQEGRVSPVDAYDVAARAVGDGLLHQADLDEIHDEAKRRVVENNGAWDSDREIDYVGEDQFGQNERIRRDADNIIEQAVDPAARAEQDRIGEEVRQNLIKQIQDNDLLDAADKPAFARLTDQTAFLDNKPDVTRDAHVLDRRGRPVVLGGWYKANAGGEGDPDEVIGFLRQDRYPGWVLVQTPDGKLKIANAQGKSKDSGLNPVNLTLEEAAKLRVQRAVAGGELLEHDQNNPKNFLWAPKGEEPILAQVGMRVKGRGNAGLREGEEGIITRIGWNPGAGRANIYVIRPGARGQGDEMQLAPSSVMPDLEGTLAPPTPPPAVPDVPNAPGGLPLGAENAAEGNVLRRIDEANGEWIRAIGNLIGPEDDIIEHADAIKALVDRGVLERQLDAGDYPEYRRVGAVPEAPAVNLPDGAENELEGGLLDIIDAADAPLRRSGIMSMDDDDVAEKIRALTDLVDRGVLVREQDDEGKAIWRRAPVATPGPELPSGANSELEADLLSIIDGAGEGAFPDALVDIDSDDAADRMQALRELLNRRIIQKVTNDDGRPVYRRLVGRGLPTPRSDEDAVNALRSGEDPIMVANGALERALQNAGFKVIPNGEAAAAGAISPNNWFISPRKGEFAVKLKNHGSEVGKVYMIKKSSGMSFLPNDVMNEVMAGAISEDLQESLGRDTPGLLYHPRVGIADAPKGLGGRAGGAVIMEHAAYGYPEGHIFYGGADISSEDLRSGDASDDIIGLGLYDYIINNPNDRHRNNQMYVKDPTTGKVRAVVIDNGYAFEGGGTYPLTFDGYIAYRNPRLLFRRADRRERARVQAAVQNFVDTYQKMDVESIMSRIRAAHPDMTPDQEAYALKWVTEAKSRVDTIALDIGAVVDTIMGL